MQNADNIHELEKLIAGQQWDKITDEDWEAMLAALSERRAWEEMWRLAQKAPAWWSVQVLLRLKEAGWVPESDEEQAAFTTLVPLAEECRKVGNENVGGILRDYAKIRRLPGWFTCLAISPDGRLLANGYPTGTMELRSLPDGKRLYHLTGHTREVTCLAISADGQILASGSSDDTIRLWNLSDGTLLHTLREHSAPTRSGICAC